MIICILCLLSLIYHEQTKTWCKNWITNDHHLLFNSKTKNTHKNQLPTTFEILSLQINDLTIDLKFFQFTKLKKTVLNQQVMWWVEIYHE